MTGQFKLKFGQRTTSPRNLERDQILAMPKAEYQGRDFFQRSDFRGLLLADYQEVIGQKAIDCVESLNKTTIS